MGWIEIVRFGEPFWKKKNLSEDNCTTRRGSSNYGWMVKALILPTPQSSGQEYFQSERVESLGIAWSCSVLQDVLQPMEAPPQSPAWDQRPPACPREVSFPFSPLQQRQRKAVPLCSTGHCQDQISIYSLVCTL